jgi:hypothetical protein
MEDAGLSKTVRKLRSIVTDYRLDIYLALYLDQKLLLNSSYVLDVLLQALDLSNLGAGESSRSIHSIDNIAILTVELLSLSLILRLLAVVSRLAIRSTLSIRVLHP